MENVTKRKKMLAVIGITVIAILGGVLSAHAEDVTDLIHSGQQVNGNKVTYNAANEITSGKYTEPTSKNGTRFLGWATTKEKADAGISDFATAPNDPTNRFLSSIHDGHTERLYAAWDSRVKYAVTIWDMDENNITFGPALGNIATVEQAVSDYSYLGRSGDYNRQLGMDTGKTDINYVDEVKVDNGTVPDLNSLKMSDYSSTQTIDMISFCGVGAKKEENGVHVHSNGHTCIHYDSWDTIIKNTEKNPYYYGQCLVYQCTKPVYFAKNKVVTNQKSNRNAYTGDGTQVLSSEIPNTYRRWFGKGMNKSTGNATTADGGWAASRLRAVLNGYDHTSDTANGPATDFANANGDMEKGEADIRDIKTGDSLYGALITGTPELSGHILKRDVVSYKNSPEGGGFEYSTTHDYLWLPSAGDFAGGDVYDEDEKEREETYRSRTYLFSREERMTGGGYYFDAFAPISNDTNIMLLRTAAMDDDQCVYTLQESGEPIEYGINGDTGGLAPCFCVG